MTHILEIEPIHFDCVRIICVIKDQLNNDNE